MKKILYIATISFLITLLFVFGNKSISAAGTCDGTDCSVGLGEELDMTVIPKDEDGNVIVGVPVVYTWVISPATLGVFTQSNTNTWTETNSAGSSTATLRVSFSATVGTVKVTATYGGGSVDTIFNITAFCDRDPFLYFAIGAVKDSGDDNWQYSTAELLETCYSEYKLYEGMGGRY